MIQTSYINTIQDLVIELTNVSGQSQGYYDSNVLLFNQQNQKFQVFLLGKDENKYKEKTHGLDVFAILQN